MTTATTWPATNYNYAGGQKLAFQPDSGVVRRLAGIAGAVCLSIVSYLLLISFTSNRTRIVYCTMYILRIVLYCTVRTVLCLALVLLCSTLPSSLLYCAMRTCFADCFLLLLLLVQLVQLIPLQRNDMYLMYAAASIILCILDFRTHRRAHVCVLLQSFYILFGFKIPCQ